MKLLAPNGMKCHGPERSGQDDSVMDLVTWTALCNEIGADPSVPRTGPRGQENFEIAQYCV
jgi:hypothetical protein